MRFVLKFQVERRDPVATTTPRGLPARGPRSAPGSIPKPQARPYNTTRSKAIGFSWKGLKKISSGKVSRKLWSSRHSPGLALLALERRNIYSSETGPIYLAPSERKCLEVALLRSAETNCPLEL